MKNIFLLTVFILILTACGTNLEEENSVDEKGKVGEDNIKVNFTEKTIPSNFEEAGYTRVEDPKLTYLLIEATEQEKFNKLWKDYKFSKEPPRINFFENKVIFFSLKESGSCPVELKGEDIYFDSVKDTLEIQITGPNKICSTDATPRTFIIEVSKVVNPIKWIEISDYGLETVIPMN